MEYAENLSLWNKALRAPKMLRRHDAKTLLLWYGRHFFTKKRYLAYEARTEAVLKSTDNDYIPRCENAGQIVDGMMIMHNGLKVFPDSYEGPDMTAMLGAARGVHEPQEERAFAQVVAQLPKGATMLELGSYWSFYSMWFQQCIEGGHSFMVEPSQEHLQWGQKNFAANGMTGDFTNAMVGGSTGVAADGTPIICVDDFAKSKGIDHIDLLHADIQGAEMSMLLGAERMLRQRRVDYLIVATHGMTRHIRVVEILEEFGYRILAEADRIETFSLDGVAIACRNEISDCPPISISKNS